MCSYIMYIGIILKNFRKFRVIFTIRYKRISVIEISRLSPVLYSLKEMLFVASGAISIAESNGNLFSWVDLSDLIAVGVNDVCNIIHSSLE